MQEAVVEEAILQIAATLIENTEIKEIAEVLDTVAKSYSISSEDAYLLVTAAKLLNRYRKAGSDIDML